MPRGEFAERCARAEDGDREDPHGRAGGEHRLSVSQPTVVAAGAGSKAPSRIRSCLCSSRTLTIVCRITVPTEKYQTCTSWNHGCVDTQRTGTLYVSNRVAEL